jgi:hypothetical protein
MARIYKFRGHSAAHRLSSYWQGSDQDTRRRWSIDLVRGLCQSFDATVTPICLEYITNMLNLYGCAPCLILCLLWVILAET